jgi:NRPS condensation-like uncharacterized protein
MNRLEAVEMNGFNRKLGVERPMLMLPLNVVMMGRVNGNVNPETIVSSIKEMQKKHVLLSVRVELTRERDAWFSSSNVSDLDVQIIPRQNIKQWEQLAKKQCEQSFEVDKGPLIRFSVLHDNEGFDLILCAHHVICDGISMNYLIRDILENIVLPSNKKNSVKIKPPIIQPETVPNPPSFGFVSQLVFGLINRIWKKKNIQLTVDSLMKMHTAYWMKNQGINLISWELTSEETLGLVGRCREEQVTVNTAIWTAFLIAQYELQGNRQAFRNQAGMAVSIRDKMRIDVGEAFGFYASSLTTMLKVNQDLPFWDKAREIQKKIKASLRKTNPFRMLISNEIDSGLIDSLYFDKYGIIDIKISKKFLRKMKWDKLNYGFSITNVGKVDIPKTYNGLELDCVYGPVVYSDVNEKTVGITTAGNKLTFVLTHNKDNVNVETVNKIKDHVYLQLSLSI